MANTTKAIATMTREEAIKHFWGLMDELDALETKIQYLKSVGNKALDLKAQQDEIFAKMTKEVNQLPHDIRVAVEESKRPKAA